MGEGNRGHYSNAEVDALLDQASVETDQAKRAELYKEAQKLIVEDLPAINIVGYACYCGMSVKLHDMPIDGAGQWGWADYSHAYFE